MQNAKDSFYVALRDRLAALNPARTVVIGGTPRPAVLVEENQPLIAGAAFENAFYISWGAVTTVAAGASAQRPMQQVECAIRYATSGSDAASGADRARQLAALDAELQQIASPGFAPKMDHAQEPPAALHTSVLWTPPALGELESDGCQLRRTAKLLLLFFPETDLP